VAEVRQREWKIPGQRTKRKAWGFTVVVNGKRKRYQNTEWTREQAQDELAKVLLQVEAPKGEQVPGITLKEAAERYLAMKARKRDLVGDKGHLERLKLHFGEETPLATITAASVSAYKAQRLSAKSARTGRLLTAAAVNRPLALLRHLLRLAHEEWEVLPAVPKIRLEKEPQGRIRWLDDDEEVRLLDACAKSLNKSLLSIVTVALGTGLRRGELLGLTWERVDFSRGVIRLETTKSGKRREVPMRQVVYAALAGPPAPHEGPVWATGSVRTSFENAVETAKVEDFHFHDLRHTFASRYVMRGGSLPALQQILGHATLAMTMRYSHLSPRHLREEMEKTECPASPITSRAQDRAHEPLQQESFAATR